MSIHNNKLVQREYLFTVLLFLLLRIMLVLLFFVYRLRTFPSDKNHYLLNDTLLKLLITIHSNENQKGHSDLVMSHDSDSCMDKLPTIDFPTIHH